LVDCAYEPLFNAINDVKPEARKIVVILFIIDL